MRPVDLYQKPDHVLREHTSANQLEDYISCARMWGFRNLLGIREKKERPWLQLGTELHWQLRCYFRGYQLNLETEAGKRALAGLHLLPAPQSCDVIEDETEVRIDSTQLLSGIEKLEIQGARDLTVGFRVSPIWEPTFSYHEWMLLDYKTTRGDTRKGDPWAYVKTPHALEHNIAGNMYAWDIMSTKSVDRVPARWVYFLTDAKKHPDARATDFTYARSDVKRRLTLLLEVGAEHRDVVRTFKRAPFDVNDLPANTARCSQMGGCPYRAETGGPCKARRTIGDMMAQSQQPPSDIEAMLAARRNGQAAPGMPPAGYPAPQAGPPAMPAPPPLAPPGPPQAPVGMPGIPGNGSFAPPAATQAPAPAAPQPVWNGQAWVLPQQAPAPQAAPQAPPGWQPAPAAPHLPPEAQLPPQMPAAPQGYVPPPAGLPSPAPQSAPQAPAAEPAKRGRKPKASAALPGGGAEKEVEEAAETDDRGVFMRACTLCVSSGFDLTNADPATVNRAAQNATQYAALVWQYLQLDAQHANAAK